MQEHDEGYIKFNCRWNKYSCIRNEDIKAINKWRNKLYSLSLIGAYPDGIGFGNISIRNKKNQFIITGSATGNKTQLSTNDYSLVTKFNLSKNEVYCEGLTKASSESLSHAVIYQELSNVNAVIHIHHLELWKKMLQLYPSTNKEITYGTPEMADEIIYLLNNSFISGSKTFAMGGHREGIISFGKNLEEAGNIILELYKSLINDNKNLN